MKLSRATFCLLFFVITSCSMVHQTPSKPPITFDSAYLNHQIRLIVIKGWPLKTDSALTLLLEYDTTNEIVFPSNYNVRIFIQQEGEWVEIQDELVAGTEEPIILSSNNPVSYDHIVGFWPQLIDLNKTYYMRVYVFGDMTTTEGIKKVAAFVDFVVKP